MRRLNQVMLFTSCFINLLAAGLNGIAFVEKGSDKSFFWCVSNTVIFILCLLAYINSLNKRDARVVK